MATARTRGYSFTVVHFDPPGRLELIFVNAVALDAVFKATKNVHAVLVYNRCVVVAGARNFLTLASDHPLALGKLELVQLAVGVAILAVAAQHIGMSVVHYGAVVRNRTWVLLALLLKCNGLPGGVHSNRTNLFGGLPQEVKVQGVHGRPNALVGVFSAVHVHFSIVDEACVVGSAVGVVRN